MYFFMDKKIIIDCIRKALDSYNESFAEMYELSNALHTFMVNDESQTNVAAYFQSLQLLQDNLKIVDILNQALAQYEKA